jgi:hypothetical protein
MRTREERRRTTVLVAIDTGSRRPVRILRSRATRHFLFLLVRCRCGKRFGHRADRPTIVCYHCGRMAALRDTRSRRGQAAALAKSKAALAKARGKARRPASPSVRRSVSSPARRGTVR